MPRSRPYASTIGRPNTITPDHTAVEERSGFSQSISSEISDGRLSQGAKGHLNYFYLKRLCRERGLLFEDLEFLPGNRLCFGIKQKTSVPVVWMRPHELSSRPKFISTDTTKFDVEQGGHGDHYLLAAISCLTLTPKFLDRVVPPDQTFSSDYCGIFRFRFWTFGEWTEVVIDDRLPSFKGRLVCLHSSDPNEFWSALLEKAYAKLYGGYHMLEKGSVARACQDLTGGIAQSFHLPKHDHHVLFQMINSAVPSSTLLAAGIVHENKKTTRLPNGLLTRHAYSITGLAWVRNRFGEIPLIRLRNPAGKGEWNGAWSERSWEWDSLPRRDKDLLNLRVRNEGEFWMSFDDFMKSFTHLDLLHIGPDDWTREPALHNKRPWRAVLAKRRFRRGYNAGGGPKNPESVPSNPQFHIHIPKSSAKKCHMVIAVTQQYTNQPNNKKSQLFPIGFIIYEVPPSTSRLSLEFITSNQPLDLTVFTPSRETVTFFTLPPGDYVVLPCTKDANCETVFLLRILIDEQCKIWEVNEDNSLFQDVIYVRNGDVGTLNVKNTRFVLSKILQKVCSSPDPFHIPAELDARLLQKVLKMCWRQLKILSEKPTFELSRCLLMLKDPSIAGRITAHDLQALMTILQRWKTIFIKYDQAHSGKTSSYHLRSLFWDAGIGTSNKVLECIVIRYVKNSSIKMEDFFLALVKLNLAHERYRAAEKKMKENRLSLEEIILMTIYS